MAWQYSEKTTQLFMDAVQGKPGTHLGELEDPDALGNTDRLRVGTLCVSRSAWSATPRIQPRTSSRRRDI
jgi:hypothetical protein